ncbi:calmodulin-binding protein 60 A-like [Impatiens glandulifera]|uniref:calmodulin-binding protein 60 A-like n=1 Tax=Impatiens glandulifera TaxID=253017 RepID=UPI001FB19DB4|nr:calmodulin-binding protein 60 A-like [Impatiens glandulifera]
MSDNRKIKDVVAEIQSARQITRILENSFYLKYFENSIRKPVKEGIEQQLQNYQNPANWIPLVGSLIQTPRDLELRFLQEVPQTIWTGEQIQGQGHCSIEVALYDVATDTRITSGPEASAKLEIVIIDGCFDVHDWTNEAFNQNVIRNKEGKNLLKGDVSVRLRNGKASIDSLHIVHRHDYMKVKKMRLGAKCVDTWEGIRVKEAKTEPFIVKDKRLIKKYEEPRLTDKVSWLKNIGRAAKKSLAAKNIITVKDFLTQYNLNPEMLKETLHWNDTKLIDTVTHARKCKVERRFVYHHSDSDRSADIVFSEVYDVVGMAHGGNYLAHSQLSETKKEEAKKLAKMVFEDKMELPLWTEPSLFPMELEGPSQKNADSFPNAEEINCYKPEGLPVMDNNCMELDDLTGGEYDHILWFDGMSGDTTVDKGKGKGKKGSDGSLFEELNAVFEDEDFSYKKAVMLKKSK